MLHFIASFTSMYTLMHFGHPYTSIWEPCRSRFQSDVVLIYSQTELLKPNSNCKEHMWHFSNTIYKQQPVWPRNGTWWRSLCGCIRVWRRLFPPESPGSVALCWCRLLLSVWWRTPSPQRGWEGFRPEDRLPGDNLERAG